MADRYGVLEAQVERLLAEVGGLSAAYHGL
jgi:hypothetical protein